MWAESTFSRAFSAFAEGELGQKIHKSTIEEHYEDKVVGHLSRDSSAIKGREKAIKKNRTEAMKLSTTITN